MSPMGSQRNFSSPSLVKRTPIQHLKPGTSQEKPTYHQNIWNNPFGTLEDTPHGPPTTDISYLQLLQAQQFPHIPNHKLKSLEELSNPQKIEIYENPSEHYAAIKYEETTNLSSRSSRGSSNGSSSNSKFGQPSHISHAINTEPAAASSSVNFYGYGMC